MRKFLVMSRPLIVGIEVGNIKGKGLNTYVIRKALTHAVSNQKQIQGELRVKSTPKNHKIERKLNTFP